jgi:hypothetical protein
VFKAADARCARLAAWGTAVLRGRVGIDDALDAIVGDDEAVTIVDLPGDTGESSLAWGFGRLRQLGVTGLVFVPAGPGDVSGLPGPLEFNASAVRAGGAVVAADGEPLGLIPEIESFGSADDTAVAVQWRVHHVFAVAAPPTDSLSETERQLMEAMHQTLSDLAALDVAHWRDEVTDLLADWRKAAAEESLPPGISDRAARIIDRCERVGELLALAQTDDGASITAAEATRRRDSLQPLARSVVRASATAWNIGLSPASAPR